MIASIEFGGPQNRIIYIVVRKAVYFRSSSLSISAVIRSSSWDLCLGNFIMRDQTSEDLIGGGGRESGNGLSSVISTLCEGLAIFW